MSLPLTRRISRSPLGRPAGTQTRGALRYFALRIFARYAGVIRNWSEQLFNIAVKVFM
jgi:hypothetical protein